MSLNLSRKRNEVIHIGRDIRVTVKDINGNRVNLLIEAPDNTAIVRGEVVDQRDPGEPRITIPLAPYLAKAS